jgi:hypothetical protein
VHGVGWNLASDTGGAVRKVRGYARLPVTTFAHPDEGRLDACDKPPRAQD